MLRRVDISMDIVVTVIPVKDDLDHPELVEEWKQNLDAAYYEKIKPRCKITDK